MAGHIVATGAGRALMERRTDPYHVMLREAWENGAVLTGGSVGALCWFQGGTT